MNMRFTILTLALLAVPVVALAQGAYSLAPFPTVAQLTAAIHTESAVMRSGDLTSAHGPSREQISQQMGAIGREYHYWFGAYEIAERNRRADEQAIASSKLTAAGREVAEGELSEDRKECDQLLADRESLREQRQMITQGMNSVGARLLKEGKLP